MSEQLTAKVLFSQTNVQDRFQKLLGDKSQGFITSVLQTVSSNKLLEKADPNSILQAAATAATLDLPINQNLGFAWIVPYKGKAQFQIGWKGFVQLALRTGQYHRINVIEVYENQFKSFNTMTEDLDADFSLDGEGEIVGYAAYFRLTNGFEKTAYWSRKKVEAHASNYSQTFGKKDNKGNLFFSPWNNVNEFHGMAKKTVLKNTLSKYGIMSIEMQTAVKTDQAVIEDGKVNYVDNPRTIDIEAQNIEVEQARIEKAIEAAKTKAELQEIEDTLIAEELYSEENQKLLNDKRAKL